MRWLVRLNLRKRPLSGNEPLEPLHLLSETVVLGSLWSAQIYSGLTVATIATGIFHFYHLLNDGVLSKLRISFKDGGDPTRLGSALTSATPMTRLPGQSNASSEQPTNEAQF